MNRTRGHRKIGRFWGVYREQVSLKHLVPESTRVLKKNDWGMPIGQRNQLEEALIGQMRTVEASK